ncbi:fatty-acid amide hydrolase 2-B-like [Calliopsis andreniformis]|uniref:fatty-acid amide hydrolase 2-B-like n=1 Tax=Calliopsis andreniformis TaxID=337506 RepID=UPI003FCD6EAF
MEIPMSDPPKQFQWKMIIPNLVILFLHVLLVIVRPFYHLIYLRRPTNLPPIKNHLLKLSVTTLARMIRNKEISSQAVVEAYIERIKEVNPFINAVVEDRFEEALNDAKICDEKLQTEEVTAAMLEQEKPLYGIPFTVKETCSLKGLSCTGGAVARRGMKSSEDGAAVELIKNAGAIPLCVSNIPEMCASYHTENFLFGATKNPYDRRRTPGGSSGGEGALIASGASILGIASDLGGSIRVPSLFNGICGHKPSPGIIPIQGHFPASDDPNFVNIFNIGPMARYMEDLHLAVKIMTSRSEKNLGLDEPVDVKTVRVFFIDNFKSFCGIRKPKSEIRLAIKKAVRHLAQNGARVRKLTQDWVCNMVNTQIALFEDVSGPSLLLDSKDPKREKNPLLEFIKAIFGLSEHILTLTFLEAVRYIHALAPKSALKHNVKIGKDIREKLHTFIHILMYLQDLLKEDGVLICPSYPITAPIPQLCFYQTDCGVYSALANLMQLPSTHVPVGLNNKGLPIGFQVLAATDQDRLCLAVAKELEKEFGGWVPPPS